jgi:hypothetical protein
MSNAASANATQTVGHPENVINICLHWLNLAIPSEEIREIREMIGLTLGIKAIFFSLFGCIL